MSLLGSWADAAAFTDLQEILDHLGVGRRVWQAFVTQVGDPANDVRLFAALPRVAVVSACSQAVFDDGSPLLPLQATQVGLVWRLSRKVSAVRAGLSEDQFMDVDPWAEPTSGQVLGDTNQPGQQGVVTQPTASASSIKERVLKMASIIDAQDESELLPPSNDQVNGWMQAYVTIMGSLPDPAEEPTAGQLAALAKRTLIHDMARMWTSAYGRRLQGERPRTRSIALCSPWATDRTSPRSFLVPTPFRCGLDAGECSNRPH